MAALPLQGQSGEWAMAAAFPLHAEMHHLIIIIIILSSYHYHYNLYHLIFIILSLSSYLHHSIFIV